MNETVFVLKEDSESSGVEHDITCCIDGISAVYIILYLSRQQLNMEEVLRFH